LLNEEYCDILSRWNLKTTIGNFRNSAYWYSNHSFWSDFMLYNSADCFHAQTEVLHSLKSWNCKKERRRSI